jgi:DNA end-binding protein Ku
MAPRAYWKGYLKLSLVSCPVALYPASSGRDKIRFHQINKATGNRIEYRKVDAETGGEVEPEKIVKGYEVGKGNYITIEPEELDAVELESTHTIEIDQFVPREEIDDLYLSDPYYIVPDGKAGQKAFAVIREAISTQGMVALGRVVFTTREHVIALEPRGKGLMGVALRYPYEVRKEADYFDDLPDEKIPKDMLELATHIVKTKAGHFNPEKFEDHYEAALKDLIERKQEGKPIAQPERERPTNIINLMDALRQSVKSERSGNRRAAAVRRPAHSRRSTRRRSLPRRKAN